MHFWVVHFLRELEYDSMESVSFEHEGQEAQYPGCFSRNKSHRNPLYFINSSDQPTYDKLPEIT